MTNAIAIPQRGGVLDVDATINAIQKSEDVGELRDSRDKAEAMRRYLQQRGESHEAQNRMAEVKVRAERRMGELLADMDMHNGDPRLHDVTRLSDLGVHKHQSHRWQTIASIPGEDFETHIAKVRDSEKELTSSGLYKFAKQLNATSPTQTEQVYHEDATERLEDFIDAGVKFGTITADPPWQYSNQATRASTDNHYGTMALGDIASLPVEQLAADNAQLYLWTTNGFLFESKDIINAWGFEYKSVMVWCKPQMGIGNYVRVSHEFLLIASRGSCVSRDKSVMSWFVADRTKHSAKPERVYDTIEKMGPGPYLEMFARRTRPGWSSWGNQIEPMLHDTIKEDVS